ncbi:hypothetical protein LSO07_10645 [Janthinobacterium sp. PLB04]|uniref:Uncharacterized protein n=1 Tax=Janthinobacterium lividum TaxID=29581 RepID=A0AAJ4MX19_9BURK|nr:MULTISPECIES: hypothetical protein [Janthinobacterium]KAB0332114.1 hypothetical protein F3B38_10705 [Janthinobacterium lividum]QSX98306.1 hypothetical protein J3P46_10625 [Janthinobacterium lividum]UGQ38296.1 hypothetical protein LSO07_10645 [Janthinobacterium sp. PLB04]
MPCGAAITACRKAHEATIKTIKEENIIETTLFGQSLALGDARITYDSLSPLDLRQPVDVLADDLGEDLLQITCANGDIVDVGWYPAWSEQGRLRVVAVRGQDWEAPVFSAQPDKDPQALLQALRAALASVA